MSIERKRFKAVLFDLGGTLIETAPIPEILRRILEANGIQKPLSEIATAHRETESQISLMDYTMPYSEFWVRWNMGILRRLNIQNNLHHLARAILEKWWDCADVELYPDVMETIEYLRERGFRTGLVTNGFKTDIDEVLSRVGLAGYFDAEVGVDAVGKPKPSEEIFRFALERLGVNPHEAIFVGDNLEIDYEGSARARLFPILIDRKDRIYQGDVRRIRRLTELREHLQ